MVDLEEEIIDKDFTQSYWLALQFWERPNRIFTVGVPQASHRIKIQLVKTEIKNYFFRENANFEKHGCQNLVSMITSILKYTSRCLKKFPDIFVT